MRPKKVKKDTLHLYTNFFTRKSKMYSGVEVTVLHLLKKTKEYFISIESWSAHTSTYKQKINKFVPNFVIPTISDPKTLAFLKEHCWEDWNEKEKDEVDMVLKTELLNKLFPNKKQVFFYELDNILTHYCHGSFIRYDDNGNIKKTTTHDDDCIDYFNFKYKEDSNITEHIKMLSDKFHSVDGRKNLNTPDAIYYDINRHY